MKFFFKIKNRLNASFIRRRLVKAAYREGKLGLKGDCNKAGPAIEKYLSVFRPELGRRASQFLDERQGYDWCCAYVYYILKKIYYPLSIIPLENSNAHLGAVRVWYYWALQEGKFVNSAANALAGDLVLYNHLTAPVELDHIGIVLKNTTSSLLTSEGNLDNRAGIFTRPKDHTIFGYIRL